MRVCPECLSNNLHEDVYLQEISCKHCGLVLEAPYEHGIVHQWVKVVTHRKRKYILDCLGKRFVLRYTL